MFQSLFSVLAPHDCLVCLTEAAVICKDCALKKLPALGNCCVRCLKPTIANAICKSCWPVAGVSRLWVACEYSNVAQRVIHTLKVDHARAASRDMAWLMAVRSPSLPADTVVVPIPTALARIRQRSFDHARLLARSYARYKKLDCQELLRRRSVTRQVGATRSQRQVQAAQAFYAPSQQLTNKRVILIDDVYTTGASIAAAAAVLRSAGVSEIYAAIFAYRP